VPLKRTMQQAFADPRAALRQLDKADAEEHLIDFVRLMWPVLEPGRTMKQGKVIETICDHLEAVTDGRIRKLFINVPPGCMKSLLVNVFWPVWEWIKDPSKRYVCFSYSEKLTLRDNRKCKRLLTSDEFQTLWPDLIELDPDERAVGKFSNMQTGFKMASSVGGVSTGERGDRVIVDDPHNVVEGESDAKRQEALTWFTEALTTRVNDPTKSAFVVIMQRIHERDISGHIIDPESNLYDDWDHVCLPMRYEEGHPTPSRTTLNFVDWRIEEGELLWPEHFPEEAVEEDERTMRSEGGDYAVAGQFQQRPAPRGGGMFKRDDFQIVSRSEVPEKGLTVRGWDLAGSKKKKAAFTAGVKIRRVGKDIYVLDVRRGKYGPNELERVIRATADADGRIQQSLPQDPGQAGLHQKAHLAGALGGHDLHFSTESGEKEDRARPLASQVAAGNVYLVRAPWNKAFLAEACTFPAGRFKDQVDAATRAYARVIQKKSRRVPGTPKVVTLDG
jgi:predicted phage terminase large subunit-like protein